MRNYLVIVFSTFVFAQIGFNVAAQPDSTVVHQSNRSFGHGFSSFGEKILKQVTWENDDRVFVIYPAGGYSSRTGLEIGIMPVFSWKNQTRDHQEKGHPNTLTASFQTSTKGMVEIRWELEWFPSPVWQIRAKTDFLKVNDRLWLPNVYNHSDDGIEYISKRFGCTTELLYGIGKRLFIGGTFQLFDFSFKAWPDDFVFENMIGTQGGLLTGAGPVLQFDSRDHILYPRQGNYIRCAAIFNNKLIGGNYRFQNYTMEFSKSVGVNNKILASQFIWEYSPGDVPFFMLPKLGGKDRLRGIGHSQRIVGKSVWLIQSELRMHLWWRFGAVAFAGMGQATAKPAFSFNEVIYSGGAGLRFRILPNDPLNIRIDAGLASHGLKGFFISLKEAF